MSAPVQAGSLAWPSAAAALMACMSELRRKCSCMAAVLSVLAAAPRRRRLSARTVLTSCSSLRVRQHPGRDVAAAALQSSCSSSFRTYCAICNGLRALRTAAGCRSSPAAAQADGAYSSSERQARGRMPVSCSVAAWIGLAASASPQGSTSDQDRLILLECRAQS